MSEPSDIQPLAEAKHIRLAIYGEPGIQKTRNIVGRCPGRVLILRPPVDHIAAIRPEDKRRIKNWVIRDWDDMDRAEEYLREEGGKYDWVWLDSLSLTQDVLLSDELDTEIHQISNNPKRKLFGPDQGVYGRNMFKLAQWLRHVIGPDLFNFGWTGHPEPLQSPDRDEDGDPIEKLMPWVQGKQMSVKCCSYMGLVGYVEWAGKNRDKIVLRSKSQDRFYAIDRYHAIPDGTMWNPTAEKIIAAIDKARGTRSTTTNKATAGKRRVAVTRKK